MAKKKLTYQDAGVDIDLYEQSLAGMLPFIKATHTPRVIDGFGGFASLFSLDYNCRLFAKNYRHPVLVTCNDGVGTKLKIAGLMNKHDTVGIEHVGLKVTDHVPELGRTVGAELLEPTRIYVKAVKNILEHYPIKKRVVRGLAHITGEGLPGNVPRVLPAGKRVFLQRGSWPIPP